MGQEQPAAVCGDSASSLSASAWAVPPALDALLLFLTCPDAARTVLDRETENSIPVLPVLLISQMIGGKSLTLSKTWHHSLQNRESNAFSSGML